MAEYIERGVSCKDCFYSGVCPGLSPFRERDDTDAERCEAYTDSKDGKLICACCKSCQRVVVVGGRRFCDGSKGSSVQICRGWYDPEHFKKG